MREDSRARKRRLLAFGEADPASAAAPLAIVRALDASYLDASGAHDGKSLLKQLAKAADALGLTDEVRHG